MPHTRRVRPDFKRRRQESALIRLRYAMGDAQGDYQDAATESKRDAAGQRLRNILKAIKNTEAALERRY